MELARLSPPSPPPPHPHPHPWRRSFISPLSRSLHHTSTQPLSLYCRTTLLARSTTHEALNAEESHYDDEEEQEEVATWSRKPVSLLSLNSKPDRNLSLLDDYEIEERDSSHKSGYVAVLGQPNVGKSTLSNQMVGQKVSIVTDKPQTTRHKILGICSGSDYQIILFDTPGVIQKEMHKLDSMMMKNVKKAAVDADCVLVVVDACKVPQKASLICL